MQRRRTIDPCHNVGFTFVELAFVFVIIALAIGAVVIGRDLVEASRLRAVVSQYSVIKTSVNTFRIKYNALPGDISQYQAMQFGLNPTVRADSEGVRHGNDVIESGGDNYITSGAYAWSTGQKLAHENVLFWQDLSSSGILKVTLTPTIDGPLASVTLSDLPNYLIPSKIGSGGFWGITSAAGINYYVLAGFTGTDASGNILPVTNLLTPIEAYGIDKKLDDGIPATGIVWGSSPGDGPTANMVNAPGDASCISGTAPYHYATDTDGNDVGCNLVIGFSARGILSTSDDEPPAADCNLPWGGSIPDGNSVIAYQEASGDCGYETRHCTNGTLSGSFTFQNCSPVASDCNLPWGGTIESGQSVTAYQNETVLDGPCVSESRTCNDGTLDGSFTYNSCQVNCSWAGYEIPIGSSVEAFKNAQGTPSDCTISEVRECLEDGTLTGSFINTWCEPLYCSLPWGGTIEHSQSVTAYEFTD